MTDTQTTRRGSPEGWGGTCGYCGWAGMPAQQVSCGRCGLHSGVEYPTTPDPLTTRPLKPFWNYFGGKYRQALRYSPPTYDTIVEPFAGAAGYSLRYPERQVVLVERYAVIAAIWRFLISASPAEVREIPLVEYIDDLPAWVPAGARYLVGYCLNSASVVPCTMLSAGLKKQRDRGRTMLGWSEQRRERCASQVSRIKHWKIIEGDYSHAPDVEATWFIDPPYNNKMGNLYVHSNIDYTDLADWCRSRRGQITVCENEGATWLPFTSLGKFKAGLYSSGSAEVFWQNETGKRNLLPEQKEMAL